MSVHPGRNVEAPMKIVEIIRQTSDVSKDILKKTVIDHIDGTLKDVESMLRVAETGVTLEFDLFGMEVSNSHIDHIFRIKSETNQLSPFYV